MHSPAASKSTGPSPSTGQDDNSNLGRVEAAKV